MRRRRRNERGFALLLIFMMAAAVALMLYMQLPREAFESERDKEQMLIDRGGRYKRAIYLYYVSNNQTWPSRIEDLESTNNHRYLPHRYIDPYTGKDEWRLIHTNGTFLTDSLVTPPPGQATPGAPGAPGTPGTPGATALAGNSPPPGGSLGTFGTPTSAPQTSATPTDPNAPPQVNAQVLRHASDQPLVQNSTYQSTSTGAVNPNDPGYQPFNPASLPPVSMFPNGYNAPSSTAPGTSQPGVNQPGLNQPGINQPGVSPSGGLPNGAVQAGAPGFTVPGTNLPMTNPGVMPPTFNFNQPGFNQPVINQGGQTANNGTLSVSTAGNQTGFNPQTQLQQPGGMPSFNGAPSPGPNPASNQAVGLINQLLTTPRQPPAGIGPAQQPQAGGGLAGIASTYKGTTIKSYGDRTKYQEWEFVFQPAQLATGLQAPVQGQGPNGSGGIPSTGQLGTPGASGNPNAPGGAAPGQSTSPFFSSPPGQTTPGQTTPATSPTPGFTLTP